MKMIISLLAVVMLAGCASQGALSKTDANLAQNVVRIDKNFAVVKTVMDNVDSKFKEFDARLKKVETPVVVDSKESLNIPEKEVVKK